MEQRQRREDEKRHWHDDLQPPAAGPHQFPVSGPAQPPSITHPAASSHQFPTSVPTQHPGIVQPASAVDSSRADQPA